MFILMFNVKHFKFSLLTKYNIQINVSEVE